jgi:hypothetical protein
MKDPECFSSQVRNMEDAPLQFFQSLACVPEKHLLTQTMDNSLQKYCV